ncbi:SDR family oxidoreductase [Legionella spiritensis]|uniref:SDR family oxidoreductase n=1 Tax=Legionella spiritensis TaxID=452 RepID=UPI000F6CB0A9|nr:SDR family oxidoreductase [Legionella spiritensis]VEG90718.1 oxidoreductase (NAD-dependent epimerase/dehydratase) [Legionella spiritensis]
MHHLIIGYGYCAYYLARLLLQKKQTVTAVSRHQPSTNQPAGLNHVCHDIRQPFVWTEPDTVLYYFVPPPPTGVTDPCLRQFLASSSLSLRKVIYCGSSGVYGDHQGAWVNEQSPCPIRYDRQKRRLNAEQQWHNFCAERAIDSLILRVSGIYGPNRLPVEAAKAQSPLIAPDEAPYSNQVYVKDLACIMVGLAEQDDGQGCINISDGHPQKMGTIQRLTAEQLGIKPAPCEPFDSVWQKASPMKREFMSASKRLRIEKLQSTLKSPISLTPLATGIAASLKTERT